MDTLVAKKHPRGAIALLVLMGVTVFSLMVLTSVSTLASHAFTITLDESATERTFYAAEAGLNEALYRLIVNPAPGNFSLNLDDGVSVQVSITSLSDHSICLNNPNNPYPRAIESSASDSTGKIRVLQIIACSSSYAGGFDSAVQTAGGGVNMANNSCVVGNIHSNGNIINYGGATDNGCKNSNEEDDCRPFIYDYKHSIRGRVAAALNSSVTGVGNNDDILAHTISNSIAGTDAHYQSIIGSVKANGLAATQEICTGSSIGPPCYSGSQDVPERELPITITVINDWKSDITNIAPAIYDDCPLDDTKYCIYDADRTLGWYKIEGDLDIDNNRVLTLNGSLWVTGNIILSNNANIRMDESLGESSVVIISDGLIDVGNNLIVIPNSNPRSFILMTTSLDRKSSVSCTAPDLLNRPAICASNGSKSIIFAAPEGQLYVKNLGCLNAAASYSINLLNNSTVTYNPNLASFVVSSSGGGETVGTALGTWREK